MEFFLTERTGIVRSFDEQGLLVSIKDQNGVGLALAWEEADGDHRVKSVALEPGTTGGRTVSFDYDDNGRLERVSESQSKLEAIYRVDDDGDLERATNAAGVVQRFKYRDPVPTTTRTIIPAGAAQEMCERQCDLQSDQLLVDAAACTSDCRESCKDTCGNHCAGALTDHDLQRAGLFTNGPLPLDGTNLVQCINNQIGACQAYYKNGLGNICDANRMNERQCGEGCGANAGCASACRTCLFGSASGLALPGSECVAALSSAYADSCDRGKIARDCLQDCKDTCGARCPNDCQTACGGTPDPSLLRAACTAGCMQENKRRMGSLPVYGYVDDLNHNVSDVLDSQGRLLVHVEYDEDPLSPGFDTEKEQTAGDTNGGGETPTPYRLSLSYVDESQRTEPLEVPLVCPEHPAANLAPRNVFRSVTYKDPYGNEWRYAYDRGGNQLREHNLGTGAVREMNYDTGGRLLAFGGFNEDTTGLWVYNLQEGWGRVVARGKYTGPQWSRDGTILLFDYRSGGQRDIWMLTRKAIEDVVAQSRAGSRG